MSNDIFTADDWQIIKDCLRSVARQWGILADDPLTEQGAELCAYKASITRVVADKVTAYMDEKGIN